MRSLLNVGFAAVFAAILVFSTVSIPAAQEPSEVDRLNKKAIELRKAGKYSEAIPLAQQILAIREKARSAAIIPMSQRR